MSTAPSLTQAQLRELEGQLRRELARLERSTAARARPDAVTSSSPLYRMPEADPVRPAS